MLASISILTAATITFTLVSKRTGTRSSVKHGGENPSSDLPAIGLFSRWPPLTLFSRRHMVIIMQSFSMLNEVRIQTCSTPEPLLLQIPESLIIGESELKSHIVLWKARGGHDHPAAVSECWIPGSCSPRFSHRKQFRIHMNLYPFSSLSRELLPLPENFFWAVHGSPSADMPFT